MTLTARDEEFSAFVATSRSGLIRSACLLTAGWRGPGQQPLPADDRAAQPVQR
jgi:hypothetical protein